VQQQQQQHLGRHDSRVMQHDRHRTGTTDAPAQQHQHLGDRCTNLVHLFISPTATTSTTTTCTNTVSYRRNV
jgi:hypothetical protein